MSPSLNDIALFTEVAKVKSFTRAAYSLNMPASTLSRRISGLEREMGVRLLKRSTRRIDLTEAGTVYFERCQHIIDEARIAHEELTGFTQKPKGRLRISLPTSLALSRLPMIIRDFGQQYPEIHCEYNLGIQTVDLLADPFDVVIRYGVPSTPGVIARQLGTARPGLFASQGYLDRHGMPMTPADLANHECIRSSGSKEDSTWELTSGSTVERIPVSGRMTFNNVTMAGCMARLDMGIVIQPLDSCTSLFNSTPLIRILDDWTYRPIPLCAPVSFTTHAGQDTRLYRLPERTTHRLRIGAKRCPCPVMGDVRGLSSGHIGKATKQSMLMSVVCIGEVLVRVC